MRPNSLRRILALLAFLLVLPVIALAGQFKVTRVYDGDTIKAQGHDIEVKVRLVGIDAAETPREKPFWGFPVRKDYWIFTFLSRRSIFLLSFN